MHVVSVDPFVKGPPVNDIPQCAGNEATWRVNARGNQSLFVGDLPAYAEANPGERFGLIFHDGDHCLEVVARDLRLAAGMLTPHGVIAIHDYGRLEQRGADGVQEGVDAFVAEGVFVLAAKIGAAGVLTRPVDMPRLSCLKV